MFWLPISLSIFLILWQLFFSHWIAISFDVYILFNTLDNQLWQDAPKKVRTVITSCTRALKWLRGGALLSCLLLLGGVFIMIASFRGDPYQSSIVLIICAIDTYGFFAWFRHLFEKIYVSYRYPQLRTAINYLLTLKQTESSK